MINEFNSWIQGIIVVVVIVTIIEMIIPNGNNKKYVKMVLGFYVVFSIISPIINKITNNRFELSSIVNINEYKKEFESIEVDSKLINIEEANSKNINSLYIEKLENDLKNKLKDRGYSTENLNIELENNDTYQIKEIKLRLNENIIEKEKNGNLGVNIINDIKIDNIDVGKENKIFENQEEISDQEKNCLIEFISETYGINKNKITIY